MWKKIPYFIILAGGIFWVFLIISVPYLAKGNQNHRKISIMIRFFFSPICHQNVERSFHYKDHSLPVCARCAGIYAGFLLGGIGYPLLRKSKRLISFSLWILILGTIPTVIEYALTIVGLLNSSIWIRSVTGFIFGGTMAFLILSSLVEY